MTRRSGPVAKSRQISSAEIFSLPPVPPVPPELERSLSLSPARPSALGRVARRVVTLTRPLVMMIMNRSEFVSTFLSELIAFHTPNAAGKESLQVVLQESKWDISYFLNSRDAPVSCFPKLLQHILHFASNTWTTYPNPEVYLSIAFHQPRNYEGVQ